MRSATARREARVFIALLTGLLAGTAVGGGAVYLFGGKRAAKPDVPTPALAKADELSLVPADAVAFVHFRAAESWKHPALAEIKRIADKAGPDALKALDETFAPAPSTLDRVTVVMIRPNPPIVKGALPDVKTGGFTPGNQPGQGKGGETPKAGKPPAPAPLLPAPPQPAELVLVLTFTTSFDASRVQQANIPTASKKMAGTREYWHDEMVDVALFFPPGQDRVLVTGTGKGVEAFALKMGTTEGALAPALKRATEGSGHVVGGLNFKDPRLTDDIRQLIPESARPAFGPILGADSVTAILSIGNDATKLELRMAYQSEDAAAEAEKRIRSNAETNRQALAEPRKQLEAAIRGKQPGLARSFKDLPEAGTTVFALGLLNLLDDLLKDPPLKVDGKEMVATIMLPSLADTALASSGIVVGAVWFLALQLTEGPRDLDPPPAKVEPIKPKGRPFEPPPIDPIPMVKPKPMPEPAPMKKPNPAAMPEFDALRDLGFEPIK